MDIKDILKRINWLKMIISKTPVEQDVDLLTYFFALDKEKEHIAEVILDGE